MLLYKIIIDVRIEGDLFMEQIQLYKKQGYSTFIILAVALLTAIGGEVKLIPYVDVPFRLGLGSVIFLLAILIQKIPIIKTGIITSITVVVFRVILDLFLTNKSIQGSFIEHLPASFFYIMFAILLHFLNVEKYKLRPIFLGFATSLIAITSNFIERIITTLFVSEITFAFKNFLLLVVIDVVRCYFVVGLYSSITLAEQRKRVQQILNIGSSLFVETLYLKKQFDQIEKITANSFSLYKQLKSQNSTLSANALLIAQEIHEVKKDSQRIYAGLTKLVTKELLDAYLISDLLQYVKEANERYSELLKKEISIDFTLNGDFYTHEHVSLLAIMNNLVANAVEAIPNEGVIRLSFITTNKEVTITVEDSGIGIPQDVIPVVFDPGYTSKFSKSGVPSTGIGLSHVQTIVTNLEGSVSVESDKGTKFTIKIPTNKLRQGGK